MLRSGASSPDDLRFREFYFPRVVFPFPPLYVGSVPRDLFPLVLSHGCWDSNEGGLGRGRGDGGAWAWAGRAVRNFVSPENGATSLVNPLLTSSPVSFDSLYPLSTFVVATVVTSAVRKLCRVNIREEERGRTRETRMRRKQWVGDILLRKRLGKA